MIVERDLIKLKISDLIIDDTNPNKMTLDQMKGLRESMKRFGYLTPIIVDQDNKIADGEHRVLIYKEFGINEIPAYRVEFQDDVERRLLRQAMNKLRGEHDPIMDAEEIQILRAANLLPDLAELIAQDENILKRIIEEYHPDKTILAHGETYPGTDAGALALRWGVPPFSVLDRRTKTWQERRRLWLGFGIASEQGREEVVLFGKHLNVRTAPLKDGKINKDYRPTVSVYDPVLAEIMIRWFCVPKQAKILDPFSGGSVRGIVASFLGHDYTGIDLREEQIQANEKQYEALKHKMPEGHIKPTWLVGDSTNLGKLSDSFDFCLTSPPYFKIEHYSDLKEDLNNMSWPQFVDNYREIIHQTANKLKANSFVAWNVGNARDPKTRMYVNQQDLTKTCFEECGFYLQNELVLIHPILSLAFRANSMFLPKRTVPKQHEYVLIFYNGTHNDIPAIDPQKVLIPEAEEEPEEEADINDPTATP